MQRRKSRRHQRAADARWRLAEERAQAERDAGIPGRTDCRQPISLDLSSYGGPRLRIEPRPGYVSSRAIDEDTGRVVCVAALKTLLHSVADGLPRMMAPRRVG